MGISGLLDRLNSDNPYVVTRPRTYLRQSWSERPQHIFSQLSENPFRFGKCGEFREMREGQLPQTKSLRRAIAL